MVQWSWVDCTASNSPAGLLEKERSHLGESQAEALGLPCSKQVCVAFAGCVVQSASLVCSIWAERCTDKVTALDSYPGSLQISAV